MKKIIYIAFVLLVSSNLIAQDTATVKPAAIGLKLGVNYFKQTNHTEGLSKSAVIFGVQYLQGVNKHVDFVANAGMSSLKYPYYTSLLVRQENKFKNYFSMDFGFNYKFKTDEQAVVPYVTAGLGLGTDHFSYYTAYAPVGGGLQIKAKRGSFVFLQLTHNAEASPITKKHYNFSVSYTFPVVSNKKPVLLPPAPVQVDGDNDGVVDSLDKCPNQKGTAKYNGCPIPDTDNDGVNDEQDKCPSQAGTAKYNGCPIPDTDKDGVNDEQDKCPTVSGLTRYAGCPIPDTDKDGVNDEEDKCPTEAGIAANHGCEDIQPLLNEIANNFKFQTGKVYLSKKALVKLDAVVAALNKYSNINLDIIGNTDNIGKKKLNQKLSEKRAAVVYAYLVKKGIPAARLVKQGVADKNPIDSNKTKKGRAKNRRTDMNAKY